MKTFLFVLLVLLSDIKVKAQGLISRIYYDAAQQQGTRVNALLPTPDKGCIIAGDLMYGNGGLAIKSDSAGMIQWTALLDYSLPARFNDVTTAADSGYIAAGSTYDLSSGNLNALLAKLTPGGDTVWSKIIRMVGKNLTVLRVLTCSDSGIALVGSAQNTGGGTPYNQMLAAKTDKNGNLLWSKIITTGTTDGFGYSVKECADSGLVFVGSAYNSNPTPSGIAAIKFSKNGSVVWMKEYAMGGGNTASGNDLEIDSSGIFMYGFAGSNITLFRTDLAGNLLWNKNYMMSFDAMSNEPKPRIRKDGVGHYVFSTNSCGGGTMAQCDSAGDLVWTRTGWFTIKDIVPAGNGYYVGAAPACYIKSSIPLVAQIGLIHTDSIARGNCVDTTYASSVFDPLGTVAASFTVTSGGSLAAYHPGLSTFAFINDSDCVYGSGGISSFDAASLLITYPSPAGDKVSIQVLKQGGATIELADLSGQIVLKHHLTGENAELDVTNIPAGIYLVKMRSVSVSCTKKLVICH